MMRYKAARALDDIHRTSRGDDMPSLRLGQIKKELLVDKSSFFVGAEQ